MMQTFNGQVVVESLVDDDDDDFAFVESLVDDEVDFAMPTSMAPQATGHNNHMAQQQHGGHMHGAFDRLSIDSSASSHGADADTIEELILLRRCLEHDPIEVSTS